MCVMTISFCIDVFVLEPCVFHGAFEKFDDRTGCLDRVASGSNATFAVSDHRGSRPTLSLVPASKTEGDSSGLASDIGSVRIDAQDFVEVGNGFTGRLVLDRAADFEAVLHVHVHVGSTSRGQTVALKELCVAGLRELSST